MDIEKENAHYICADCRRQFIDDYQSYRGYSDEVRRECLLMYVNGMGFRAIEREIGGRILLPPTLSRVKGVHHTTVISWIKAVGELLPDAYNPDQIPLVGELDGCDLCPLKKKIWLWTAVDHFRAGILGWVLGNHSGETFAPLWEIVATWRCSFIVTDGWSVYPGFIPLKDQTSSKTYMTRVEGENTRLRDYLARLHRKTLCYSKSLDMLAHSIRLLIHYLKFRDVPLPHRA